MDYCYCMPMLRTNVGLTYLFLSGDLRDHWTGFQKRFHHTIIRALEKTHDFSHVVDKEGRNIDLFSIHFDDTTGTLHQALYPDEVCEPSAEQLLGNKSVDGASYLSLWKQQFMDAFVFEQKNSKGIFLKALKSIWFLLNLPWKVMFAFVPPYHIAHGWVSFICSLLFISGIAYIVTKLTDIISCVTGINAYVIAFTALATGTSWPDLVASKIAAQRQTTADSAIANITCSNSVNIYVGIGIPWLIDTTYSYFAYHEPLRIDSAEGLSFSLLVFFSTSVSCILGTEAYCVWC